MNLHTKVVRLFISFLAPLSINNFFSGILDFYFFVDSYSSPDNIIQQYQEVIGRPAMPPYWALGFHQCRWGYKNIQEVRDVVTNFESNKV